MLLKKLLSKNLLNEELQGLYGLNFHNSESLNEMTDNFDEFQNLEIKGVSRDSRTVKPGDAYFCLTEDEDKAKQRCDEAKKKGALVIFSNFDQDGVICVNDTRKLFADACANFYNRACDKLKIIGVTGTNGKTTTTHLIAESLKHNGRNVGVIGTNGVFYNNRGYDCPLTTPDADFLHKTFHQMYKSGVEYVVMEVSAHAIAQRRIDGIMFDVGVLTNITQDHLDYFKTFEEYEKTKLDFFTNSHIRRGVVCVDDPSACKLLENPQVQILTYGIRNPSDAFAIDICCSIDGSHFVGNVCDEVVNIKTNLMGKYNVLNCLASMLVCKNLGLDGKQLESGLNYVYPVEGRFNVVNLTGKNIVIDYAHTPDGLKNVLETARELTNQKLFVVFGCGGNRDKDKRHKMGEIAEKYADVVCLTDDNPRTEKSEEIIADIEQGMHDEHYVIADRTTAIRQMIDKAEAGDVIVVAGKGAEKYQEVGTEKKPYNDFDAVYQYFKEKDPILNRGREW